MSKSQEDVERFIREQSDRFLPSDTLRLQEINRFIEENVDRFTPQETPGFFKRYGTGLLQFMADMSTPTSTTPGKVARSAAFGGGLIEGAILSPMEAASGAAADISEYIQAQFPNAPAIKFGLEDNEEYVSAFRAAEDFFHRVRYGILDSIEEEAIAIGVMPDEIATARAFGNFVGAVAPIHAAYSIPNYFMNIPKLAITRFPVASAVFANLPQHFIAGAMFGGLFEGRDSNIWPRVVPTLA